MEHRHFYKVPVLLLAAAPLLAAVPRAWNLGAVTLVPAEQAVDGEKLGLLRADARDALTGRLAEVSAEMWLTRVEDSFISNDKLVVLGQAGRAEAVVIFDLLATREIDWFYCYRPRHLSDDWITYVEWYPEHASAEPTDVILVYDLALAPLENRLEKERNVNVPPRPDDNPSRTGFPIYPDSSARLKSYLNHVADVRQAQHIRGEMVAWLPSKKLVVVVDEGSDASNYRTQIVVVDLSRGLSNPASYRLDAPIGKLPRRGENPEMMRVTRAEGISADQVRLYVPESEYGVGSIVMDINP